MNAKIEETVSTGLITLSTKNAIFGYLAMSHIGPAQGGDQDQKYAEVCQNSIVKNPTKDSFCLTWL